MTIFHFILIDDNELDLFISQKFLTMSGMATSIRTFNSAEEGLEVIVKESGNLPETILLLDLQMPGMSGFEFVDAFSKIEEEWCKKLSIYILSSTVDKRDIEKARQHPNIKDILSKPLDIELLKSKLAMQTLA